MKGLIVTLAGLVLMSLGYGGMKANGPTEILFLVGAVLTVLGGLRLSQMIYPTTGDRIAPRTSYVFSVLKLIREVIFRR